MYKIILENRKKFFPTHTNKRVPIAILQDGLIELLRYGGNKNKCKRTASNPLFMRFPAYHLRLKGHACASHHFQSGTTTNIIINEVINPSIKVSFLSFSQFKILRERERERFPPTNPIKNHSLPISCKNATHMHLSMICKYKASEWLS